MRSLTQLRHHVILVAKSRLFAGRGEPYRVGGKTLRFVPGTRPVRLRYQDSENSVNLYDAMQLAWLLDNLGEGDVAIDVGANPGQYTIAVAERCGLTGTVIAFEPNPSARAMLERNIALNPTVKNPIVESLACWDVTDGEAVLYQNGASSNSGLAPPSVRHPASVETKTYRVGVTTVDAYLNRHHVPEPRVVKIDAEGAEIRILRERRRCL